MVPCCNPACDGVLARSGRAEQTRATKTAKVTFFMLSSRGARLKVIGQGHGFALLSHRCGGYRLHTTAVAKLEGSRVRATQLTRRRRPVVEALIEKKRGQRRTGGSKSRIERRYHQQRQQQDWRDPL